MSLEDDLIKEEFIQSYLQYRWLDETRSKLIDRFFVVIITVFAARLHFVDVFDKSSGWTYLLYSGFIFFSVLMAKSIVCFRRQQRGHGEYIKGIRSMIPTDGCGLIGKFDEYKKYIDGKRIHVTRYVELIVVAIAALSSLSLLFDPSFKEEAMVIRRSIAAIILFVANIVWVGIPFWKYNFKKPLDWNED